VAKRASQTARVVAHNAFRRSAEGNATRATPHKLAASPFQLLVRVHLKNNADRPWVMLRSEIEGLSPKQIKDKFSLPYLPEYVSDVDATGLEALTGITNRLYGGTESAPQILLLEDGARFFNTNPL
jgi:hypothetical protein